MSGGRYVAGGQTPSLKDCFEEGNFIRSRTDFQDQVQHGFTCVRFRPDKNMQYGFVQKASDNENGSMNWVENELLSFHQITETYSSRIEYFFPHYVACARAPEEVGGQIGCSTLRCSTTEEIEHSALSGEALKSRTELNLSNWVGWRN